MRSRTGRFTIVSIETVVQIQFGYRWMPGLQVLPNGDWLLYFCWTEDAYFARSAFLRSSDRGHSWEEGGWPLDSGAAIPLPDGTLAFYDSFYPLWKEDGHMMIRGVWSKDYGRTFEPVNHHVILECSGAEISSLADIMKSYFTLTCYPWGSFFAANGYPRISPGWPQTATKILFSGAGPASTPVVAPDGRILCMSYCKAKNRPNRNLDHWMAYCLESADLGRSWRKTGEVPWSPAFGGETATFGNAGFTEADLALLPNGEMLALLRAGSGFPLATSRSADLGDHWSPPGFVELQNTGELAKGIRPTLVKMADGALACTYGRPGIHLICDPTGTGHHWQHEMDLRAIEDDLAARNGIDPASFGSSENVSLAELAPGELGIVYDFWQWTDSKAKPPIHHTIRLVRLRTN